MRGRFPLVTIVLTLAGTGLGTAQFVPPGWSADVGYISRVSQAANQLFYQVEQLRIVVAGLRPMPPQAVALIRRNDAYYEDTLGFSRMLQRSPPREQVEREYRRLDRSGDDVVRLTRDLARQLQDVRLFQAASRIEYADQFLSAAVSAGKPISAGPGTYVVRLARSLDGQAEDLLRAAQAMLRTDPLGRQVERDIRGFSTAADRFRQTAEAGQGVDQLKIAYVPVGQQWGAVLRTLAAYQGLADATIVRQQAQQVNGLVDLTARSIGVNVPGVPLPDGGPSVNWGRGRGVFALGADAGGGPHVRVFQSARVGDFHDFIAYHPDFRGGVRVAVGDVDGDGVPDVITAPGRGMRSLVRVFSGRDLSLIREFLAFDGNYANGVWVAASDIQRDRRAEIICGADEGGLPIVRVFDGQTGQRIAEFAAYEPQFRGGVRVTAGDVNGDGVRDIITVPGPGRPALVRVFDGRNVNNVLAQFDAYGLDFIGGAFVTTADFGRTGRAEIVTSPGAGGGPHVRVFDALRGQVSYEFFAYDEQFRGGTRVACRDVNRDGIPDLTTAPGPGMPALVRVFNGRGGQVLHEFLAYDQRFLGGAFVSCR